MFVLPEHNIAFEGLKEKVHQFEYTLGQEFFDLIGNEDMSSGLLEVSVDLDKRSSMLVASIKMQGQVSSTCDRCTGAMELVVSGELRQIFKTSAREEYDDEEVMVIPSNKHELNLSSSFYECLVLAFPARKVHEEQDCDQGIIEALTQETEAQEETDPRWNALRGFVG